MPIRAVIEELGGTVIWEETERMVELKLDSKTIELWIDRTNTKVNGKEMMIDVAPIDLNGRTYLPVRFVAENLGYNVTWDGNENTIIISNIIDVSKIGIKDEGDIQVESYAEKVLAKISDYTEAIMEILDVINKKCEYGNSIEKLTDAEKVIFLISEFEEEVNNGGFSQFYFNNSGQYADETIDALKEIGANNTAQLLERALSICKDSNATWKKDGVNLTDDQEEQLSELDEKFYEYPDDLLSLQINFIKSHVKDFK